MLLRLLLCIFFGLVAGRRLALGVHLLHGLYLAFGVPLGRLGAPQLLLQLCHLGVVVGVGLGPVLPRLDHLFLVLVCLLLRVFFLLQFSLGGGGGRLVHLVDKRLREIFRRLLHRRRVHAIVHVPLVVENPFVG